MLPRTLEVVSDVLPLTYAVDAMQAVATHASASGAWGDLLIVAAFALGVLVLGAATLRRRTA
jgi:ABC-2 type transport system permease protein